jgi:epothilone synthetase B
MLIAGGSIVIPDSDKRLDPAHWSELMIEHKITFWNSVPSFLEMYVDYLENKRDNNLYPSSFRMTVLSGDWIPVSLPDRLRTLAPDIKVIGSGGPTETTIWDIHNFIGKVDPSWKSIPYGKPLTNATYYVMKDNLEECPDYVTGELCIGGAGLARGFWKDEQKTKEKFIRHPKTGERLYKSGDLGFYRSDGMIQIVGRKDFQVKIRGLRVELGEIESVLEKNSEIKDAVVTAIGDSQTNKRLVAYIVPSNLIPEQETKTKSSQNVYEASVEQTDRDGSLLSEVEKMELKIKHLEIRQNDAGKTRINLLKPEIHSKIKQKYLSRQTYRTFQSDRDKISLKKFSEFVSCLAQYNSDELPFPKYRYPSAGSLYPVQVYLYIKPDRIEGIEGGTYYYHPKDQCLILLNSNPKIKKSIHTVNNYQTFEDSAFSVFLVAEMRAIAPVYGAKTISERVKKSRIKTMLSGFHTMMVGLKQQQSSADVSRDFCVLEAGYMGQLLMTSAQENQIGLCPVGGVDFSQIQEYFDLQDSHMYIHGFLSGPISTNQTKTFTLISEMSGATGSINPKREFIEDVTEYLNERIPDYMVPSSFVIMDQLPLTPNGKVDRKALPVPEDGMNASAEKIDMSNLSPSVEKIAGIVQGVLKMESVNPLANLFNIGATSIQIIMITNQLESKLAFRPRIDEIYTDPTIAAIALKYDKYIESNPEKSKEADKLTSEAYKTLELLKKVKSLSKDEIKLKLKQVEEKSL